MRSSLFKIKGNIKRRVRRTKGYLHNRGLARSKENLPLVEEVDRSRFSNVKIVLIAVDALSWKILNPLLSQGRLPNLASLIREGSRGPLKTIAPALSPELWNSIGTGKIPAKHGITGFMAVADTSGDVARGATFRHHMDNYLFSDD